MVGTVNASGKTGSPILRPALPRRAVRCRYFSRGPGKFGAPHALECTLGGEGRVQGHESGVVVNGSVIGMVMGGGGCGVGEGEVSGVRALRMKWGGQGLGWGRGRTSLR